MLKSQLLIVLLLLISSANCDECSDYLIRKEQCQNLSSDIEGQSCYYDGSNCISAYTKCEDYKGTEESECSAISPYLGDDSVECYINEGKCSLKLKYCSDYISGKGKDYCEMLHTHTTSSRCIYNSLYDSCREHHDECKDADSSFCSENIPSDIRLKCSYDEEKNECKGIKRKCNEYNSLSTYGIVDNCWVLEASTEGKNCILDSFDLQCKEAYKQCEDYTADPIDEDTCKNIKPYIKDTNEIDYSHKCVVEDNACVTRQRTCEEYDYSIESDTNYCTKIKFDGNSKIGCFLNSIDYSCYQNYISCEGYTGDDSTICSNIIPLDSNGDPNHFLKCDIKNSKCVTLEKECKDFDYSDIPSATYSICDNLPLSDKTKQCVATSSKKCIEVPKKCEDYTGSSEEECQLITPYLNNNQIDLSHYCIYEDSTCKAQLRKCESQTNTYPCNYIILSETKRCLYLNSKCQEFYKKCEDYKGTDGETCARITPFKSMYEKDEEYECVMEKDKKCTKKKKEEVKYCNYQGYEEETCAMFKTSNPDTKICTVKNTKCIEQYKYCSDYKGTYGEVCRSINPYDSETNKIDPYSRCDFQLINYNDGYKCIKKGRTCTEYYGNDPSICSKHYAEDENKKCVLKGNQCREQYKTCETYTGDSQTECENIILSDYTKKCVFLDSRCQTKSKTCSEFNTDFLGNICASRSLNDYKKKCVFQSGSCSEHVNTCNEITFANENEASEEKCNAIETPYDDEICTLKRDKSGCRRISKSDLEEEKRMEEELKKTDTIIDENSNLKTNTIVINNIDSTIKYNNEIDSDSVTDYKNENITDNATNTNTNRNSGGKILNIMFGLISISLLLL